MGAESINGEPASPEELADLETKAFNLLKTAFAENFQEYGFATERGSYVLFGTCLSEEEVTLGPYASICVGRQDETGRDIKFGVTFGYENQPTQVYDDEEDLEEALDIVKDLLYGTDPDASSAADKLLLELMQQWISKRLAGVELGRIDIFASDIPGMNFGHTGDLIRQRVWAMAGDAALRNKSWSMALGDEQVLMLSTNEFLGEEPEVSAMQEYPQLEIKYEDRKSQITYVFTKSQFGEVSLRTYVGFDHVTRQDEEMDLDVEEEIEEFLRELNANQPGKNDVKLLIDKLQEASIMEAT